MRLAVFQAACGGLDLDARMRRLSAALDGADCDLVVCPELLATGYHIDGDHRALAQPARGAYFDAAARIARTCGTAIVFGYPEADGAHIYNAAALVDADGALLANHRKRLAAPGGFEESSFVNGDRMTLVEFRGVSLAIVICYEIEFPESARAAALAGADCLIAPTALVEAWPVVAEKLVPTRAFENGLWVAYANHGGAEAGHRYLGGSRIVAPSGVEAAVAGRGEALIVADIDRAAVVAARARLPYLRDCARL